MSANKVLVFAAHGHVKAAKGKANMRKNRQVSQSPFELEKRGLKSPPRFGRSRKGVSFPTTRGRQLLEMLLWMKAFQKIVREFAAELDARRPLHQLANRLLPFHIIQEAEHGVQAEVALVGIDRVRVEFDVIARRQHRPTATIFLLALFVEELKPVPITRPVIQRQQNRHEYG